VSVSQATDTAGALGADLDHTLETADPEPEPAAPSCGCWLV